MFVRSFVRSGHGECCGFRYCRRELVGEMSCGVEGKTFFHVFRGMRSLGIGWWDSRGVQHECTAAAA
jgi:hypothetical protein